MIIHGIDENGILVPIRVSSEGFLSPNAAAISLQINHPELQINAQSDLVLAWQGSVLANFYVYNVVGLSLGLVLAGIAADSDGFIRLRVHNQTGAIVSPFILMAAARQV